MNMYACVVADLNSQLSIHLSSVEVAVTLKGYFITVCGISEDTGFQTYFSISLLSHIGV